MQNLKQIILEVNGESIVCEYKLADKNAVIIHGGGAKTQRKKYYPVAEELLKRGVGVILFDLSGHGESSGTLAKLSLERRKQQTIGVINALIPSGRGLYLIGFSMGAHTVCDLLPYYGSRIEAILLGCPAIYRADVQDLPFGTDIFTDKLREPDSWRTSNAIKYLADYEGKTVICIGDKDDVIPQDVIELLKAASKNLTFIELNGASHALMSWLPEHTEQLKELMNELLKDETSERSVQFRSSTRYRV